MGRGIKKGVEKVTQKLELLPNKTRNIMVKLGGGEKKVIEFRQASPELMEARQGLEAARQSEKALVDRSTKWKNPGSARNQKRLSDAANLTAGARENLTRTKEQVTQDAFRRVRNKGIKRLSRVGTLGALGLGAYSALTSGVPEQSEQSKQSEQSQSKYRYTSNNGWEKNEDGKWSPQQKEFGIDRNGNVNYYDGQNWVSDYIQDSDGTIYNRQGQVIGSMIDPIGMHASGYDNIFDYNAAQAGIQPEQVAAVQQALGVIPDGKWGARTQAAYEQAMNNIGSQYDPNSLFSIYQRKMQYGY